MRLTDNFCGKRFSFLSNITNERDWWVSGYPLGGIPFEGNAIFAYGSDPSDPYVSTHIFKLDTRNGNILWRTNTTKGGTVLTVNEGQLVIQNDNLILGLNEASGSTVWTFDVGTSAYQPTAIYGDLLIFGAQNGNLYALHLPNGTLAWKTHFDRANLLSLADAGNKLTLLPIQIDSESEKTFWTYGVTVVTGPADNLHADYTGYIISLALKTGSIAWTHKIEGSDVAPSGWAVNKNTIFFTQGNDLWTFDEATSNVLSDKRFDHYVLPPVLSSGTVFVAADLHLTAYT